MERYRFSDAERFHMERSRMPFAIYQFIDKRVVALILSDGFCELFEYADRAEAYRDMDTDMYRYTHPDDAARIADAASRFAREGGRYEVIYRTKRRNASGYKIVHSQGEHMLTETGVQLAQVWYTDEGSYTGDGLPHGTRLNQALSEALHQESLLQANYYDFLTGLPGMTYFFELAEAARDTMVSEGRAPVLLFFDLNGMKFYNQKNGFAAGDVVLRAFARLLKAHFSNENCSRFGQDHFAVVTDEADIEARLDALIEDWHSHNGDAALSMRVGIYPNRVGTVDISTACDRARFACEALRNSYASAWHYFDASMLKDMEKRRYILDNLDRALSEKWIQVYYQPIIRAVNGRVCDEEALARWVDPVKGLLPPIDFIPVLEETRLIYKVDLYVVEQVLEKIKSTQAAGLFIVPQSINLSRSDFDACDMVEEIRRRVDESGVGRDKLTIEITESIVGSDFEFIKAQVQRFRDLGFPVWMDDFGSGYSSLDVLQSIKFNLIKFDMRFMQEFDQGDSGKIILTELMKMAGALGVDTICEGVETEAQVRFLREIGCSKLQGYYYGKPMPLSAIFHRYETGTQIGFENPAESKYFETIGRVNLHDLSVIAHGDASSFHNFFNTLPMAVMELKDGQVQFVRTNQSYRDFLDRVFHMKLTDGSSNYSDTPQGFGASFMKMVRQCCESGNRAFIDDKMPDNSTIHSYVRRLSVNPVTGAVAAAVVVLSIMDAEQGANYESIAKALAADYYNIFYVDLETERFIEYTADAGQEALSLERHGEDFFNASRRDARKVLCAEDQTPFIEAFTKENILKVLDANGQFRLNYRQIKDGAPVPAVMKVMRMSDDKRYIVIGVRKG